MNLPIRLLPFSFAALAMLTAVALAGCAADTPLARIEANCSRISAPEARADCDQKSKDAMNEFKAYREKEKARDQAVDAAEPGAAPKNSMCFKRAATGEVVCPN